MESSGVYKCSFCVCELSSARLQYIHQLHKHAVHAALLPDTLTDLPILNSHPLPAPKPRAAAPQVSQPESVPRNSSAPSSAEGVPAVQVAQPVVNQHKADECSDVRLSIGSEPSCNVANTPNNKARHNRVRVSSTEHSKSSSIGVPKSAKTYKVRRSDTKSTRENRVERIKGKRAERDRQTAPRALSPATRRTNDRRIEFNERRTKFNLKNGRKGYPKNVSGRVPVGLTTIDRRTQHKQQRVSPDRSRRVTDHPSRRSMSRPSKPPAGFKCATPHRSNICWFATNSMTLCKYKLFCDRVHPLCPDGEGCSRPRGQCAYDHVTYCRRCANKRLAKSFNQPSSLIHQ